MFGKTWKTSERKHEIFIERHVSIPMSDGVRIDANIFRPDDRGRFPAILGVHPYDNELQSAPLKPAGMCVQTGGLEAGDYNFYVRRGYIQVTANQRGTGRSGGEFTMLSPRAVQDVYEIIEWIAGQPWCDGNVGTFGASWLAMLGQRVAHLRPPHLKAIFSPFAVSDQYRDALYHGGILNHAFHEAWADILSNPRFPREPVFKQMFGEEKFKEAVARALSDSELTAVPFIEHVLKTGMGPVDTFLMHLDCDFYRMQATNYEKTEIPAYLGACWGSFFRTSFQDAS
ncbi:MAG: CocE/NonD family hydrolase [Desulfobacteraceae bacterium]|nr:MAG: CocE/NonD family hydrolase [Desulfobacteraceae bacterium]